MRFIACLILVLSFPFTLLSQEGSNDKALKLEISQFLNTFAKRYTSPRRIWVDSIIPAEKRLILYANDALEDIPFREDNVSDIYLKLDSLCPGYARIILRTRGSSIEELIPAHQRKDKPDKNRLYDVRQVKHPLTQSVSRPFEIKYGLRNRHLALWPSHGMYYSQSTRRWEWQRARMFGTVEDLYTQSFVLPFLVPMLENAGANVLIPRERDTQPREVIVDNDRSTGDSDYKEINGDRGWVKGQAPGFAHLQTIYADGENPFQQGSFSQATTLKKGRESQVVWLPSIPETGDYAVYVSYQSLPGSTQQAFYTIHHAGGETTVAVNQSMGGGTWIYLGHYRFKEGKGENGKVTLTNRSHKTGEVITADAVKIGGGMGNIGRKPADTTFAVDPETSGYPRFTEAARYGLQWAGMPDSIYSETQFANDYRDDIFARGKWVNYLKDQVGIPLDLAFALHSDAGVTPNDSIIGTLGIYMSKSNEGRYTNGKSRETARDLTDMIQSQIVSDIRRTYDPAWNRRGMWNQSYIEARLPDVPTMLLELLSHQNFADMRDGLDPKFRFLVSRSIYKGMLRYISFQNRQEAVVQPLPPVRLYTAFVGQDRVKIGWEAMTDSLEPSALPTAYVLYTRKGDGGFDNGVLIRKDQVVVPVTAGIITSYKVVAVNEGGMSFPSEIMSVYRPAAKNQGTVLLVNGFDRTDGPVSFDNKTDSTAGFLYAEDRGVSYLRDIAFIGEQYEFRRSAAWETNDLNGFGDSYNDYAGQVIAGNSFDYPFVHGEAIAKAGFAFVSCSQEAIVDGTVRMSDYPVVDWIAGKQRDPFAIPAIRDSIQSYLSLRGNLLISGTHLFSGSRQEMAGSAFVSSVLKGKLANGNASRVGIAKGCASPFVNIKGDFSFRMYPNAVCYPIESVDGLLPTAPEAYLFLRYPENNMGAGLVYKGDYRTCLLGFPFETLQTSQERELLMGEILRFFQSDHN